MWKREEKIVSKGKILENVTSENIKKEKKRCRKGSEKNYAEKGKKLEKINRKERKLEKV